MTAIAVAHPTTSPFRPESPCTAACIDAGGPQVGWPTRAARIVALIVVVALTAASAALVRLVPGVTRRRHAASLVMRSAARGMLAVLGVDIHGPVPLPDRRTLVVANHISWLDIVALLASDTTSRLRLVAKVEVARWPVIGPLAAAIGTIFIDRTRPLTLRETVADVRHALAGGDVVVAFAEGTTCCGVHRAPYRPAMFQAALDSSARVVPLAIRYADEHGETVTEPAFIGDETLVTSIRRLVGRRTTRVHLRVGPALTPQPGAGRRRVARVADRVTARELRGTPVLKLPRPATTAPSLTPASV